MSAQDQKARPVPPNPPGAACQPAQGGPSDLVAWREWTAQDFADEMAQLRFVIQRVTAILTDEPAGLDRVDGAIEFVRELIEGARAALPLMREDHP